MIVKNALIESIPIKETKSVLMESIFHVYHASFVILEASFIFKYKNFLNVFMARQSEIARRLEKSASLENDGTGTDIEGKGVLSRSKVTQEEHPLSLGKSSIWNQFFQVPPFFQMIFSSSIYL